MSPAPKELGSAANELAHDVTPLWPEDGGKFGLLCPRVDVIHRADAATGLAIFNPASASVYTRLDRNGLCKNQTLCNTECGQRWITFRPEAYFVDN